MVGYSKSWQKKKRKKKQKNTSPTPPPQIAILLVTERFTNSLFKAYYKIHISYHFWCNLYEIKSNQKQFYHFPSHPWICSTSRIFIFHFLNFPDDPSENSDDVTYFPGPCWRELTCRAPQASWCCVMYNSVMALDRLGRWLSVENVWSNFATFLLPKCAKNDSTLIYNIYRTQR